MKRLDSWTLSQTQYREYSVGKKLEPSLAGSDDGK
jgi:hypothetical protein